MSRTDAAFRREAEERAKRALITRNAENNIQARPSVVTKAQRKVPLSPKFQNGEYYSIVDSGNGEGNTTPLSAKLAELDYNVNGNRARADSGCFVGPRWVLDEESSHCSRCATKFDWIIRKHHCRHCGFIYCSSCSSDKLLLPANFGFRDPQRVCVKCKHTLLGLQKELSCGIANHLIPNPIDLTPGNWLRHCNYPYGSSMAYEIHKATYSMLNIFTPQNQCFRDVPSNLLANAKGLVFLTMFKAGYMAVGGRCGTGIMIRRLPLSCLTDGAVAHNGSHSPQASPKPANYGSMDGVMAMNGARQCWSAPLAIGSVGVCTGVMLGADVTDYVLILNTEEAVQAFGGFGGRQVAIGAEADVAAGMLGRSISVNVTLSSNNGRGLLTDTPPVSMAYAHSRGLYAGVSLHIGLLLPREELNFKFYGQRHANRRILHIPSSDGVLEEDGLVLQPIAAKPLYDAISQAMETLEPMEGFNSMATAGTTAMNQKKIKRPRYSSIIMNTKSTT